MFRGADGDDSAAFFTAARAHVDNVVRVPDDVQIVFNNDDRRSVLNEIFKYSEKCLNVQWMKSDGRFVKDKNGIRLSPAHFTGQLQTLSFTAGKTRRFFSERQVPKPQIPKRLKPLPDDFQIDTEIQGRLNIPIHQFRERTGDSCPVDVLYLPCRFGVS